MKKTALTMAISSLLLAGGAQASTVYNQDGTKLDIGGRVQGMYYGSDNDDESGDQKMSFSLLGIPQEGFGFSGNKRIFFGPPSFNNAKFEVAGPVTDCEVKMKYF